MGIECSAIIDRAQAEYDKIFRSSGARSLDTGNGLLWIKDAVDEISGTLGIPRATDLQNTTDGGQTYPIPADAFDGSTSIISVTYNGKPVHKRTVKQLQDMYLDDWQDPPDLDGPTYWCVRDSDMEIFIVGPTGAGTDYLEIIYVQAVPQPTSVTDQLPDIFNSLLNIIPIYLVGKMGGSDKQKNFENTKLAEFSARLTLRNRRRKREGKTQGREAYTSGFNTYNRNYGKRGRRR